MTNYPDNRTTRRRYPPTGISNQQTGYPGQQASYQQPVYSDSPPQRRKRKSTPGCGCCLVISLILIAIFACSLLFLLFPGSTDVLILGIDYTEPGSSLGRSDTIILTTFDPFEPYLGMLSIPRDLWVTIPGIGENRINTAHFYGELTHVGLGPELTANTIKENFGITPDHYIRIKFDGVRHIVNAMGGLVVELDEPMAGYPAGTHQLTGNKALAFARHRQGSDDFFRMQNGQFLIKSMIRQLITPKSLLRLPAVVSAATESIDSDIPSYIWPRLFFTFLRTGIEGIDNRTITREMVMPFMTVEGASVLAPDWAQIAPLVQQMFYR